jgi:glycosyltransferase involved in cell wall biosynthesis
MFRETTEESHAAFCRTGRPRVSVVIPNHNYGRYLPGCLNSILRQNLDPRTVEILFVDDASSDGSLALARRLLADMPLAGYRVLSLPRTGRPGPVRNAGLAEARGLALLTLDPDDELLPDFLPRCLEALDQGADAAYADYLREEAGEQRIVRLRPYHKLLLANQNILPPTALFRRELWDNGARFRTDTMYEDWDFWIQLALHGASFTHVAEPLYRYRVHDTNFSLAAREHDVQSKARIVMDNAAFFPSWTVAWARGALRSGASGDLMPRGIIPVLPEHAA